MRITKYLEGAIDGYTIITVYDNTLEKNLRGFLQLREIRERRGMTQRTLAEKTKMSYVYISNLENGKVNVSLYTLRKLAKVLKVTVADLVADE